MLYVVNLHWRIFANRCLKIYIRLGMKRFVNTTNFRILTDFCSQLPTQCTSNGSAILPACVFICKLFRKIMSRYHPLTLTAA